MIALAAFALGIGGSLANVPQNVGVIGKTIPIQSASGPLSQSLLHASDITNDLKCFRVPSAYYTNESYFAHAMAYDPAGNSGNGSIFASATCLNGQTLDCQTSNKYGEGVIEFSVPNYASLTTTCSDNIVSVLGGPIRPFGALTDGSNGGACEGHDCLGFNGFTIGGLTIPPHDTSKLCGAYYALYDGSGYENHVWGCRSKDLSAGGSGTGLIAMNDCPGAGTSACASRYRNGPETNIPTLWQTLMGGKTLVGNGLLSIIGTTSAGLRADVMDFASLADGFTTTTLMSGGSGDFLWTSHTTAVNNWHGVAWPDNTRSILYLVSRIGDGTSTLLYGTGINTTPINGTTHTNALRSGSTASTSTGAGGAGCRVTVPNADLSVVTGLTYIQLSSQTSPAYIEPLHPTYYNGTSHVAASGNSGTASAYVDVDQCFPDGLSGQSWNLGAILAYDPDGVTNEGYHQYPYLGKLYFVDATDLYHSGINPADGSLLNGQVSPYDSKTVWSDGTGLTGLTIDRTNRKLFYHTSGGHDIYVMSY